MTKPASTTQPTQEGGPDTAEPREAALQQVERETAEQQRRTHRFAEREAHDAHARGEADATRDPDHGSDDTRD